MEPRKVYVGYDPREDVAYHVCVKSMLRHSTVPLAITMLDEKHLRATGKFWRPQHKHGPGHGVDLLDGKPFSTEFSFTRFLIPELVGHWGGWVLFCDLDFLWRADVAELFDMANSKYAVMVVKHEHFPMEKLKMDGVQQTKYRRKNWSSLILWNTSHPRNIALTAAEVNSQPGSWLHGFRWLDDRHIGALPEEWNWLAGWSDPEIEPKAVHYTRGGPWLDDYENVAYADEWRGELAYRSGSDDSTAR